MNTHSTFDSKRFGRLIAHDLKLNTTRYLLMLAAFFLILYLFLLFQMRNTPHQFMTYRNGAEPYYTNTSGYVSIFIAGLIGLGLFIGLAFSGFGNKISRMSYLQLPASTFEKYLHPFLIRFVGGTVMYFLMYWIAAQLAFWTFDIFPFGYRVHEIIDGYSFTPEPFRFSMLFSSFDNNDPVLAIIMFFVSIAAYLFAAPMFFRKQALIKSILFFFVVVFMVVCVSVLFSHLFFPNQIHGFNVRLDNVQLSKNLSSMDLAFYALTCSSWLFFLVIGYFKLKEMKV